MASKETCFENGERSFKAKNYTDAVSWYRQGAQQGHAPCQNMLGICYYRGYGVAQDYRSASEWFLAAANNGFAVAQNNLGNSYYHGQGVPQDYTEATKWYLKAAEQGNSDAQNNLGNCYYNGKGVEQNYPEAVKWYGRGAARDHVWCQYNLANCYYNGKGVRQNFPEAVSWYRAAAEQGNLNAQNALGNCYYNGKGLKKNYTEAVNWYRKAADKGYAWAQYNLGNCYYNGNGVERNYAEALRWYRLAADQNIGDAHNRVGLCYHWGNGVEKDRTEAAKWFLSGANLGFHWAQNNIANSYYKGDGVPQDYAAAVKWYRAAADQGNEESMNSLGNCYYNGKGVAKDQAEAVKWYRRSAEKGYNWAMNNLGNCYYHGNGVEQDYAEAVKWYRAAAEKDLLDGMNNLGNCLYHGNGVEKDDTEAVKWYRKAAEKGHAWAQCNLAFCYRNGYGVEKDLDEARRWYDKSARQGNETARKALDELGGPGSVAKEPEKPKPETREPERQVDPEPNELGKERPDTRPREENRSLEELLQELESMTGLSAVKQQVKTQIARIRVEQMAREKGLTSGRGEAPSRHMVFTGNPGTGKTTVARLIGRIYGALGVLPRGDVFVECSRTDLVAEYVGQTAKQTQRKVDEAMGGILFVDEAYSLYRDEDNKDFGREAIDTLIQAMENHRDELIVILAGYTKPMHFMLQHANPGLKSRVRTEIRFDDYSPTELFSIFESMLTRQGKHLASDARDEAMETLARQAKDPDFGNARGVRNLVDTIQEKLQLRLAGMRDFSEEDYCTVQLEDIRAADSAGKVASRKTLQELLAELDGLVGLESAKEEVRKRVAAIQVEELAKKAGVRNTKGAVSPHMVFTGNPGTGKTTVARLVGQIYAALGVLPKGNVFVECTRADLVGTHVGETAPMVQNKVQEAMGGVLFIDEAYSLYKEDSGMDYGLEAIETLIQCMENNRGNLVVILAGYTDEMHKMLQHANPGLRSRIGAEVQFSDYTVPDFCNIFRSMLGEREMHLTEDVSEELLTELFTRCAEDPDFGNARGVRNTVDRVVDARNTRLFEQSVNGVELQKEDFETICAQDIRTVMDSIKTPPKAPNKNRIGF